VEAVERVQAMYDVLTWAAEHYRVGLLTNTMPGFVSALRQAGIIPDVHYDAIVDSSEVGALKPEAKIYEIAAERAGCPAEELMFIDDYQGNLIAAAKLGWHVMWFDDARPEAAAEAVRQALEPAN
jgi:putative hydrolase of the HAD superfamily